MTEPAGEQFTREEARELLMRIWESASHLANSGHWDLVNRAAEVKAMAHYMLYDFDAGVEADR